MNTKIMIWGFVGLVVVGGAIFFMNNNSDTKEQMMAPAVPDTTQTQTTDTTVVADKAIPSVTLMTSTGELFSKYKYFSKAYEVFPTFGVNTKKQMGAFSYVKKDLGNNTFEFTLTNQAEGYQGKSVIVSGDQKVYFIEPALADDNASEDSNTTDDFLVAVNAKGEILK